MTPADDATRPIRRAFLLGLVYGLLRPVRQDRKRIWHYTDADGPHVLRSGGRPVEGELPALLEALYQEPTVVERVLERAETFRAEDFAKYKKSTSPRFHRFYRGATGIDALPDTPNLLDVVFRLPEGVRGDSPVRAAARELLGLALDEIAAYYDAYYGSANRSKAGRMAARLIDKLWEESKARRAAPADGAAYQAWAATVEAHRRRLSERV